MQEDHPHNVLASDDVAVRNYYLIVTGFDALDLPAAQAQLNARGFAARLEADTAAQVIRIHQTPAAAPAGGPRDERHELRFARLAPAVRQDIIAQLDDDGETVPPLLRGEALVAATSYNTDTVPVGTYSLIWTTLAELLATARDASRASIYDPEWGVMLQPDNVREMLDWEDIVEEIAMDKEPLTIFGKEKLRQEQERLAREQEKQRAKAAKAARKAGGDAQLGPGEQRDGMSAGLLWVLTAIVAAAVAWYWLGR